MTARPDVVAVLNPISGGGVARTQWDAVAAELARFDVASEAVESGSAADASRLAADAAASGALTVAVGGDGQIRDVAAGVLTVPGAPLGIAAAGRGNDFVRHLGIPTDAAAIAAMLADGRRRDVDVLTVGDRIAVGNVYVGLDSVATELINRLRWMGPLAYRVAPVLAALRWKPAEFTITVDGSAITMPAHIVVVANSGDYGSGLNMVPSASVDSGRIDVLAVDGGGSMLKLVSAMGEAKTGSHVSRPEVVTFSGREVTLSADRAIPVHADGDYVQELPVTVGIRRAVLPVVVPH
ncbi:diacylglycerol kinase family protein [Tsukamurella sp. 1534]|uniref:diacylglycerol/lipid kinase family protein n=1 Tax=Tsukamurella sp. 1534 TaxID=1151061 RepID=UPI0002F47E8C|nr:diacylglycerol kinase family protein [Tsukamurella sp. 1534]